MAFLFSSRAPRPPFVHGKVPTSPEHLQPRSSREPQASFDTWLETAVETAAHHGGSEWAQHFPHGAPLGFMWRAPAAARADAMLGGLLVPSRDAVGRLYPFVVATELPLRSMAAGPHVAPLALGAFLEHAYELSTQIETLPAPHLAARAQVLLAPGAEAFGAASQEYESWSRQTSTQAAWDAILDVPGSPLDELCAVVATVRDLDGPGPTLRLPLGRGGNAAAALWLDIVRRLCGTTPTALWDIANGWLVVALGQPTETLLGALWLPTHADTGIWDVPHDLSAPPRDEPLGAALERLRA